MAKFTVVLAFVAAVAAVTSAASVDEKDALKVMAMPILEECGKEFGVSKEDLASAKAMKNIDAIDSCYYGCVMKKFGLIKSDGLFDVAAAKEKGEKFLSDPEDIKRSAEVAESCASVNEASVSDGDKGCERAKLLIGCLAKGLHGYKTLLSE